MSLHCAKKHCYLFCRLHLCIKKHNSRRHHNSGDCRHIGIIHYSGTRRSHHVFYLFPLREHAILFNLRKTNVRAIWIFTKTHEYKNILQARDDFNNRETDTSESFVVTFVNEKDGSAFTIQTQPQPGSIHAITITNAGSGCTVGGTLSASGGGGTGFSADFTEVAGAISAVSITSQGQGYTTKPTLVINTGGTGCTGYTLSPEIMLLGDHHGSFFTTLSGKYRVYPSLHKQGGLNASYFNNMWFAGQPVIRRVDPTVNFDWGMGKIILGVMDQASVRWEGLFRAPWEPGIPSSVPPGGIWKVDVLKPGFGCTVGGTITTSGGGGGSGFQATFSVGALFDADSNGAVGITQVVVISRGAG
jgi:hypothetical protein